MKKSNALKIVTAALFAALTCVCTVLIAIPLPQGYANSGDAIVISCGFFLGAPFGVLAAAIGSAMADIFAGCAVYAPATFVIKGLMALCAAALYRRQQDKLTGKGILRILLFCVLAEAVMVSGYFVFEIFLYSLEIAAADIVGNLLQGVVGAVLAVLIISTVSASPQAMKLLRKSNNK